MGWYFSRQTRDQLIHKLIEPQEAENARSEVIAHALRGNVRPMPGARELLDWARSAGLPMALASSSKRTHVELSLAETGLAGSFDAEVCGDEVERGKPEPEMFLLAAERIGAAPEGCVVLEDAPAGLAAAHAAGMRGLWVPNEKTRGLEPGVPVAARLASLSEAQEWIAGRLG